MNKYYPGQGIRYMVTFKNAAGQEADPGTVTFKILDPSGVTTSYIYDTDPEVVRDGQGEYHCDVTGDESGLWTQRWEGTDPVPAVSEARIRVLDSDFTEES